MPLPATSTDALFLEFQEALAGRYSLDREVGRGGMGIVYLAREVHLDRLVAIKLLPPALAKSPSLRERVLREAQRAAMRAHPNSIPIHAVEESEAFVFYVMAFVDGETLTERVGSRGPLSASEGTRLLRDVAWALAYAHAQGLVHRDVKPDNILIERATGRVLVADFGIAGAMNDIQADTIVGTPEFMSPEQALGHVLDARSDIYSLGATAFFALTGRLPFEGKTPTEVLAKQVAQAAPRVDGRGVSVSRKLAALVDRCLAKDPEQRPQDARQLGEQLEAALEQRREPPVALRAFVRRHGRLDGGGTVFFGLMFLPTTSLVASIFGAGGELATVLWFGTMTPLGYFVFVARRLAHLGFRHEDLAPAFRAELERSREELVVARGRDLRPTFVERALRVVTLGSLAAFAVTLTLDVSGLSALWLRHKELPFLSGISVFLNGLGWLTLAHRRSDVDTAFWSRVWSGPIGRFVFGIARRTLGSSSARPAMTHRATELSLGLAAEQLFESLPRATRDALGDLPAVLRRLGQDATQLRARHQEIADLIAGGGERAAGPAYADVRASRDRLHTRLGEVVASMETIRLQLLRLHAGTASVQSVTTHLGLAGEVSDQVERLIAAHDEVERGLAPSPTPA